jgi:hypothetical protein
MRLLRLATVASVLAAPACVPGGPVYIGPPVVTIEGYVYQYESQTPAVAAEVCAFGTDTLCIATDGDGHYRTAFRETFLLADSSVSVRYRIEGLRPAIVVLTQLMPGETTVSDCAISNRVALTREPAVCLPVPRH